MYIEACEYSVFGRQCIYMRTLTMLFLGGARQRLYSKYSSVSTLPQAKYYVTPCHNRDEDTHSPTRDFGANFKFAMRIIQSAGWIDENG